MDRRIMFNEDANHYFLTRGNAGMIGGSRDEAYIREFIRQYEGTQVSDFMLNCFGRIASYPSALWDSYLDKYYQTEENGCPVDYKTHPITRCYRSLAEQGIDFYAVCIEELRRIGIRPWMSIRMNDCHYNNEPTSILHPNFYHEHPEYRRVRHHEPMDYFDRCFDYAVPEVYKKMLDTVEEVAMRYDADGMELDWQREVYCFRIGREYEGIEILNRFTRDTRAILDRAEKKWGHPIMLAARTMRDPQMALDNGFDAAQWAREGLIDVLIPTPRWQTTDSDIPVEMWKRLLAGTGVKLAAGIERLQQVSWVEDVRIYTMPEHVNALAAQYLSEGADWVYLYNYMDYPDVGALRADPANPAGSAHEPENNMRMLRTIGDLKTVERMERRHVLTFPDVVPVWYDMRKMAPLPLTVKPEQAGFLRLRVGEIPADATVEIRLGVSGGEADAPTVYVNSEPCQYLRSEEVIPAYTQKPARVYAVKNDGKLPPFLVVEMIAGEKEIGIYYAEAHVFVKEGEK